MDPEDLLPRRPAPKPRDLETMGVEELKAYLAELESEAEKVRAKIASKTEYLDSAERLFRR